jgi:hypothetical protein
VTFSATAEDASGTPLVPTCTPASGALFPVGTTTVTCTATDARSVSASGVFSVTVVLNGAPTLTVPGDITLPATGPAGATVSFRASAFDAEDGELTPTCNPASGTTFAIGTTRVTCMATDSSGLSASGTFDIAVRNNPPTIAVPADITVEAHSPGGAVVAFSASGMDVEDGPLPAACQPAAESTFPVGTTRVTCTVADSLGATASGSFQVTVIAPPAPCEGPDARRDTYSTRKNARLAVAAPGVLANDTDPSGHPLTAVLVSGPSRGRLALRPDGGFTYTPAYRFTGTVRFVYAARDAAGRSDRATVTIEVGHFDHDGCDHDRRRGGHREGDGCDHDRRRRG